MEISNKVQNLENVEVILDSTTKQKFYFGDIERLRGQKIKHIDIPSETEVPVSPLGKDVVNNTVYAKSFLVLVNKSQEKINRLPLKSLNPFQTYGKRLAIDDLVIDWPKSYIEVGSIPGIVANEVFFVNIYY